MSKIFLQNKKFRYYLKINMFKNIPKEYIKIFNCDNRKEFAKFKQIKKDLKVYFANPYHL